MIRHFIIARAPVMVIISVQSSVQVVMAFLEVASMVVNWWIVAFFAQCENTVVCRNNMFAYVCLYVQACESYAYASQKRKEVMSAKILTIKIIIGHDWQLIISL